MENKLQCWVITENFAGEIKPISFEMLNGAKSLVEPTGRVITALCLNADDTIDSAPLFHHGADAVVLITHPALAKYTVSSYLDVLVPFIRARKPDLLILPATNHGKELAPALAASLGTGLATDCIALELDGAAKLQVLRPVYAGKALASVSFQEVKPSIVTLRANVFRGTDPDNSRTGPVEKISAELSESSLQLKVREIVKEAGASVDITEARIVVSGGLGMQGPENFKVIEDLAAVLGAAVGASRPVVDNGWRQYSNQVGQTGRTVSPDLYIACGISGSVQHLAGMSSSKCIVAINKDPHAPIFTVADYGIVGDALEVVPLLTSEFKKIL